ncbi:MAG: guanine deaminase [Planctomycetaceae bacterium]
MPDSYSLTAVRGPLLHFTDNPFVVDEQNACEHVPDGMLVLNKGRIIDTGPADDVRKRHPQLTAVEDFGRNSLIMPGFVDVHSHYSQTHIIGAYGEQLLDWLNRYTFPEEMKFADHQYASAVADTFLNQLLSNGTTTAMVFATSHPVSVDAFFEQAQQRNLRMIAGKVLMDRNAPSALCDTPESAYHDTKRLINTWHRKPGTRLEYAITPRFAPTSSDAQLEMAGRLKREHPDVAVQSHLSENRKEVQWVAELFPDCEGYLDVYDQHRLVTDRSVFAHCIHTTDAEVERLAAARSAIAFCPTANLFLGSGLFDLRRATDAGISIGLGTDIGAGTSFSMLQTMGEAYKVAQLQQQSLSAIQAFYLATLGGARALKLDDRIGSFTIGKEADFIVLNLQATPLLDSRMQQTTTLEERLFVLMTLGDDRTVQHTFVHGTPIRAVS